MARFCSECGSRLDGEQKTEETRTRVEPEVPPVVVERPVIEEPPKPHREPEEKRYAWHDPRQKVRLEESWERKKNAGLVVGYLAIGSVIGLVLFFILNALF